MVDALKQLPLAMTKVRPLPIIEIFGPTIQGEGVNVGVPVHFIRTGGCDYRCSWCDTPFAVLPEEVRKNARMLTPDDIVQEILALPQGPRQIVISGGNPAILNLEDLIDKLHDRGFTISIETQGSRNPTWLSKVDLLTVSPKPPSSHMDTNWGVLTKVLHAGAKRTELKVVVFNEADMEYAKEVHRRYPNIETSLSMGTDVGVSTRDDLLDRLAETVAMATSDPDLAGVRLGLQMHVLLWGHKRGV